MRSSFRVSIVMILIPVGVLSWGTKLSLDLWLLIVCLTGVALDYLHGIANQVHELRKLIEDIEERKNGMR